MELKYIQLSELFGEPIVAERVDALAARLSRDPRFADIAAAAQKKKNIEKRAETLSWLYLLENVIPDGARVLYCRNGKPIAEGVHFSVSHSGGVVAAAVGKTPVGLDIERVREYKSDKKFAERYFTENERAIMEKDGFFAVWTKKEAYFKKTGEWGDISSENIETRELNVNGEKYIASICK